MEEWELIKRIEELRYRLYRIADGKYLVDPEVVGVSQELDQLINRFYELEGTYKLKEVV